MSSREHVRSVMRRAVRTFPLNILVMGCAHERYEQMLCKTNHNFYSFTMGKEWDKDYGSIPPNYKVVDHIPNYIDFDLIMTHVSDERLEIGINLARQFNIPIIRHTHTIPQSQQEKIAHKKSAPYVDLTTFISKYSMLEWDYGLEYQRDQANYVNHGIDNDFWTKNTSVPRNQYCLSVVNLWEQRDWACGWNIWKNDICPYVPTKVLGKNPGLSDPAKSLEDLRAEYHSAEVFLNTSLHSPVPMSLMEAMACGCAVVSTNTCMVPEIIQDGHNGFLCNTSRELLEKCKFLLENNEFARQMGLKAQETIQDIYSLDKFTNTWDKVINKVLYK